MNAIKVAGAGYQRRELRQWLPLTTPFALHLFPSHYCNFRCAYCVHGLPADKIRSMGSKKTIMDVNLFEKCITDVLNFPERLQVLIFAGWGEPLTHPNIVEMVELAKRNDVAKRIEIVSNGAMLTNDLSKKLIEAGLDRIRISIQGLDSVRCSDVAGVNVNFESLLDNIRYFHANRKNARIFVKTVDAAVPTDADRQIFHGIFEGICDEIAVEQVIPVIKGIDHSRFGSEFNKRHCGGLAVPVAVCPFPFYMSVVHPDGSYAPCCSSELPLPLGNVGDTSITEIWNGEALWRFRVTHLKGTRGGATLCRRCPRPQYDIQEGDDLDPYAGELLSAYQRLAHI
ncbi:MAG: radical SAM protein [Syntrophobacteraceae bacterium CG07_land_8_20_14_0_80_61_8]|nr:MAG: radical SAM protein [Syntrophobacteraceae bacterium CG07_land_8_20_14_0_80_61_8]